ncbi:MAG: diacylglycerol kinase [Rhizobiaceae bacterium MnEN-MB40S]|nr:MAG: diacylglycerol kinase [Rhizobiaceae bacterium MnEN-MB40S]
MKKFYPAFLNSWHGLVHAARNEQAFRYEVYCFIVSAPLAAWLADTALHFAMLVGSVALLMIVELLNTGIEAVCDGLSGHYMKEIKIAKDCGSAAVLLCILLATLVWLAAIIERTGLFN